MRVSGTGHETEVDVSPSNALADFQLIVFSYPVVERRTVTPSFSFVLSSAVRSRRRRRR